MIAYMSNSITYRCDNDNFGFEGYHMFSIPKSPNLLRLTK